MPFRSEKQRKYLFAKKPAIAKKWTKKYGSKIKDPSGKKRKDFKGPKRAMGGVIDFNKLSQQRKKVSAMNKGGMARACGAIMESKRKITKFS